MALSDMGIKALKPKDKRYTLADGRGLTLEVYPTGGMGWRFRYRLNGRLEKVALGKYPAVSLKDARRKRDELAVAVAKGQSPAREKQAVRHHVASGTPLREFGDHWYAEVVCRARKAPKQVRRYLDNDIYPALGSRMVRDITAGEIQTLVFRKRNAGFEAAAIDLRNVLKRLFDYAVVRGVTDRNPVHALPSQYVGKAHPRTRTLAPDEIRVFLRCLYAADIRRAAKLALHVILLTLVRKSELLLAKWDDVNFDTREWGVPEANSKTGKPHIVYLSTQAVALFQELHALAGRSEYVLPSAGDDLRPCGPTRLNAMLETIHAPLEPFTIHDLRRTGSTLLHELGYPSDVVEKALNHTIGGVRGVYNRAQYSAQRREMLQRWGELVEALCMSEKCVTELFSNASLDMIGSLAA